MRTKFSGEPQLAAESPAAVGCEMRTWELFFDSAFYNPQSEIGRPLEPDAVNTVEGRNSYSMTVPFPFDQGGAVF